MLFATQASPHSWPPWSPLGPGVEALNASAAATLRKPCSSRALFLSAAWQLSFCRCWSNSWHFCLKPSAAASKYTLRQLGRSNKQAKPEADWNCCAKVFKRSVVRCKAARISPLSHSIQICFFFIFDLSLPFYLHPLSLLGTFRCIVDARLPSCWQLSSQAPLTVLKALDPRLVELHRPQLLRKPSLSKLS